MRLARRIGLLLLLVVVAFGLLAAWQAYQLRQELMTAEAAFTSLDAAVRAEDVAARNTAAKDLTDAASAAAGRSDGFVWDLVGHAPIYGDDAQAVAAVSQSLDVLASGAIQPLLLTVDSLDGLTEGGRVDVEKLESIREPVRTAREAALDAQQRVDGLDGDNYVDQVRTRVDDYKRRLDDLVTGLGSGERALQVLPTVLGAEGPRDYLLVFQNNAEIRATGGIPGSWALVHADNGELEIVRQGSAGDFPNVPASAVPITQPEREVYSDLLGVFWQDATFTPDWPRAAELLTQHWEKEFAPSRLDGVISLDPVAISYLLNGTGPVAVGDITLDAGNAVDQLLSAPYVSLDGVAQDLFFAEAAKAIFDAITGDLASPLEVARGLNQAVAERRFLVALVNREEAELLRGTGVAGTLPSDDGRTPRVVVALNDATASKMSYYLRYDATIESTGCIDGRQTLVGRLDLRQTITAEQAVGLPVDVTGPGDIGIPLGSQLVVIRLYSPTGGSVEEVTVAGSKVAVDGVTLDGRDVVTVVAQLSSPQPIPMTWHMTADAGQVDDGQMMVSPGVERESSDAEFSSAC